MTGGTQIWETVERMPLTRLRALHRAAKRTGLFRHPRAMMKLRAILEAREAQERKQ